MTPEGRRESCFEEHARAREELGGAEGAKLTTLMDDERPPVDVAPEDEEAMLRALASIKAGRGVALEQLRAVMRRL